MIYRHLLANIDSNIRFYRRNSLLMVVGLFLAAIFSISLLFALISGSENTRFNLVQGVFATYSSYVSFLVGIMALLTISQQLGNRSVRMVLTRPCLPETWLLAGMLAPLVVAAWLYLGAFVIFSLLMAAWGINMQLGLLCLVLSGLAAATVTSSAVTFLTVLFQPVSAALIVLFLGADTFFGVTQIVSAVIGKWGDGMAKAALSTLYGLKHIFYAVYFMLPETDLFASHLRDAVGSYRFGPRELAYLAGSVVYSLVILGLFHLLSVVCLKRKRLI